MGHLKEADSTCLILTCPKYIPTLITIIAQKHIGADFQNSTGNIQEEVEYLGHIYYAEYKCFLCAIDHMDYHPSVHVKSDPKAFHTTNHRRSKRETYHFCTIRQYFNLSTDEINYLCKLKVVLKRVKRKLHHNRKFIIGLP